VAHELVTKRAATIVIGTCGAIVAGSALVLALPGWRLALGLGTADQPAYALGQRVDVPAGLYDAAPLTLLIFARSSCPACERAKPAFAVLAASLRDRAAVRVTMVVDEGQQAGEREYLRDVGLPEDRLAAVDFRALRLRRIPTTVLVDRDGRVLYSQEGEPSALDAAELLRMVSLTDARR
jgi:thiol-disulfide isomerase/thioredoxin